MLAEAALVSRRTDSFVRDRALRPAGSDRGKNKGQKDQGELRYNRAEVKEGRRRGKQRLRQDTGVEAVRQLGQESARHREEYRCRGGGNQRLTTLGISPSPRLGDKARLGASSSQRAGDSAGKDGLVPRGGVPMVSALLPRQHQGTGGFQKLQDSPGRAA